MSNQDVAVAEELIAEEETVATAEVSPSEVVETAATPEIATDLAPQETNGTSEKSAEIATDDSAESSETPEPSTPENEEEPDSIYKLEVGQKLTGTVKNIVDFGAFVDVGIPQDGLVHISKLAKHKVEKVSDVVSQGQEIEVWVKKVDTKRGRLSLTMIKPVLHKLRDIEEGAEFEGTVTRLESYGAFVDIDSDRDGLVHISQITHEYIKHPEEALKVGDPVKVKVLSVNRKKRQIDLSIKALLPEPVKEVEEVKPREEKFQRREANNKPRRRSKARTPKREERIIEIPGTDDEPQLTAMAVAYAAAMQEGQDDGSASQDEEANPSQKENSDMDEIVSRTLASRES